MRLAQEALSEHEARGAALLNEVAVLRERRSGFRRSSSTRGRRRAGSARAWKRRAAAARLAEEQVRLDQLTPGEAGRGGIARRPARGAGSRARGAPRRSPTGSSSLDLFQARVEQESSARSLRAKRKTSRRRRRSSRRSSLRSRTRRRRSAARWPTSTRSIEQPRRRRGEAAACRRPSSGSPESSAGSGADEIEKRARRGPRGARGAPRDPDRAEEELRRLRRLGALAGRGAEPTGPDPRTVGDVLHASGDGSVALEAALGEAVQFIVAERTESALQALKALEESGEGRATFIALDRISRARVAPIPDEILSAPGVRGPLIEHVRFEPATSRSPRSCCPASSWSTRCARARSDGQHRAPPFRHRDGERGSSPPGSSTAEAAPRAPGRCSAAKTRSSSWPPRSSGPPPGCPRP